MKRKKQAATKEELGKSLEKFDERAEQIAVAWRAILGLPNDFAIIPIQVYVCMAAAQSVMDRLPATKAEVRAAEKTLEPKKGPTDDRPRLRD